MEGLINIGYNSLIMVDLPKGSLLVEYCHCNGFHGEYLPHRFRCVTPLRLMTRTQTAGDLSLGICLFKDARQTCLLACLLAVSERHSDCATEVSTNPAKTMCSSNLGTYHRPFSLPLLGLQLADKSPRSARNSGGSLMVTEIGIQTSVLQCAAGDISTCTS